MPKKLDQLSSPIPNYYIIDGTCNKLTANDWLIYHILAMHQNYTTNISNVRYKLIKKYKNLSGSQIAKSIAHLQQLNLIQAIPGKKQQSYLLLPAPTENLPYAKYLKTAHWRNFRAAALNHYGTQCQICSSTERINVHHKKYNLWHEKIEDVTILCEKCHMALHKLSTGEYDVK